MPILVEVTAFALNRDELTEQFCINIEAPTLDCRAACYLGDQVAQIGGDLSKDTSSQATDNPAPNSGPSYVLPNGLALTEPLSATLSRSNTATHHNAWRTRCQDVASPPPLG